MDHSTALRRRTYGEEPTRRSLRGGGPPVLVRLGLSIPIHTLLAHYSHIVSDLIVLSRTNPVEKPASGGRPWSREHYRLPLHSFFSPEAVFWTISQGGTRQTGLERPTALQGEERGFVAKKEGQPANQSCSPDESSASSPPASTVRCPAAHQRPSSRGRWRPVSQAGGCHTRHRSVVSHRRPVGSKVVLVAQYANANRRWHTGADSGGRTESYIASRI